MRSKQQGEKEDRRGKMRAGMTCSGRCGKGDGSQEFGQLDY